MWNYRAARGALALAATLALFAVYRLCAVPFLEPEIARSVIDRDAGLELPPEFVRLQTELSNILPAGSWELDRPTMIQGKRITVLLEDYRLLANGNLDIRPCTFVLQSNPNDPRGAIFLQCPAGAEVQFDRPLNPLRGQFGEVTAARLMGELTIFSVPKHADGRDRLRLATRDVFIEGNHIWTEQPVSFEMGESRGQGRQLRIELDEARIEGTFPLRSLELAQVEKLYLQWLSGPGSQQSAAAPAATSATRRTSMEIRCQGSLLVDFERGLATFERDVDVLHFLPQGPSDQLSCEILHIHFSQPRAATGANETELMPIPEFRPRRLHALGNPVIVRSPSRQAIIKCEQVRYDAEPAHVVFTGSRDKPVWIDHLGQILQSQEEVEYWPDEANRLGRLRIGPGTFSGPLESAGSPVRARWGTRLVLVPDGNRKRITMTGRPRVESSQWGWLEGDELQIGLVEMARLPATSPQEPVAKKNVQVNADEVRGIGNVSFHTETMFGTTQLLEIDLAAAPRRPPARRVQQSAQGHRPRSPLRAPLSTPPISRVSAEVIEPSPITRFDVSPIPVDGVPVPAPSTPAGRAVADVPSWQVEAEQITLQVARLPQGEPWHVERGRLRDRVRIRQQPPGQATCTLDLQGDEVRLHDLSEQSGEIDVDGHPAQVQSTDVSLRGPRIHLDRPKNRLSVAGAGSMTTRGAARLTGDSPKESTWQIFWKKQMEFDGLVAKFWVDIHAHSNEQNIRSDELTVALNRMVSFAALSADTRQISPQRIAAQGGPGGDVQIESRTLQGPTVVTIERLSLPRIAVDLSTGALNGEGPGWLSRVGQSTHTGTSPRWRMASASPTDADRRPTYMRIQFRDSLVGNVHDRVGTFRNNVRVTYGPVDSLDGVIDLGDDRPEIPGQYVVRCRELAVQQRPNGDEPGMAEATAEGDVQVQGQNLIARGEQLSYSQAKDQVILAGDGRADAEFTLFDEPSEPPKSLVARRIRCKPDGTNAAADDMKMIDLGRIRSENVPKQLGIPGVR